MLNWLNLRLYFEYSVQFFFNWILLHILEFINIFLQFYPILLFYYYIATRNLDCHKDIHLKNKWSEGKKDREKNLESWKQLGMEKEPKTYRNLSRNKLHWSYKVSTNRMDGDKRMRENRTQRHLLDSKFGEKKRKWKPKDRLRDEVEENIERLNANLKKETTYKKRWKMLWIKLSAFY